MSVLSTAYREAIILTPLSKRLELAGSIRRNKMQPHDVDILMIPISVRNVLDYVSQYPKGNTGRGNNHASYVKNGTEIEIYFTTSRCWGAALLYVTGSNEYNIMLRTFAKGHNMKLSQYGLFKDGKMLAGRSEEEIYKCLGKKYKEPCRRGEFKMKKDLLKAPSMEQSMNQVIADRFPCFGDPYGRRVGANCLCRLIDMCPKHEECWTEIKRNKQ